MNEKPANKGGTRRNKDGTYMKGVSGNPSGRPKNTMKDYLRRKFASMSDEDKEEFLKNVSHEVQFKMAEGNPDNKLDADFSFNINNLIKEIDGDPNKKIVEGQAMEIGELIQDTRQESKSDKTQT